MLDIDPFTEDVLFGALRTVKAWQMVNDPKVSWELDSEGLLMLCKDAGYSEASAQKAATDRANARMDRGLMP
jgi:hypothetical protein